MELDLLYSLTFDKSYQEFLHNSMLALTENNGKALYYKRNVIFQTLNETFKAIDMKQIAPGNYIPDLYTQELIRNYFNHRNDYETNPVTYFIEDHLEQIKDRNKDHNLSIPENIRLSRQETVELLAQYEALGIFLRRLDSIEKDDALDIVRAKLSQEGYKAGIPDSIRETEIYPSQAIDNEQTQNFRKEFTLSRQILAVQYLFKLVGIKETHYDKTRFAEFIRFLTGRELGNKTIKSTNIYKKLRSQKVENVDDLTFIRKYFSDLNLTEVVRLIDEEIASAG